MPLQVLDNRSWSGRLARQRSLSPLPVPLTPAHTGSSLPIFILFPTWPLLFAAVLDLSETQDALGMQGQKSQGPWSFEGGGRGFEAKTLVTSSSGTRTLESKLPPVTTGTHNPRCGISRGLGLSPMGRSPVYLLLVPLLHGCVSGHREEVVAESV